METTLVRQIFANPEAFSGKTIRVSGWVRTNRNSNKFGFIELNDGTCFKSIQVVYEEEKLGNFAEVAKFPIAAGLACEGVLELTLVGENGGFEFLELLDAPAYGECGACAEKLALCRHNLANFAFCYRLFSEAIGVHD